MNELREALLKVKITGTHFDAKYVEFHDDGGKWFGAWVNEEALAAAPPATERGVRSDTVGPAELWLADLSLRCPKCASPALTSNNKREHRCLHCLEKCTDETALPSVRSLIDKAVTEALAAAAHPTEKSGEGWVSHREHIGEPTDKEADARRIIAAAIEQAVSEALEEVERIVGYCDWTYGGGTSYRGTENKEDRSCRHDSNCLKCRIAALRPH